MDTWLQLLSKGGPGGGGGSPIAINGAGILSFLGQVVVGCSDGHMNFTFSASAREAGCWGGLVIGPASSHCADCVQVVEADRRSEQSLCHADNKTAAAALQEELGWYVMSLLMRT